MSIQIIDKGASVRIIDGTLVKLISGGPRGEVGPQGVQGIPGVEGLIGPVGGVGPEGPVGPAGAQGAQGIQGPVGPVGPVGPAPDTSLFMTLDTVQTVTAVKTFSVNPVFNDAAIPQAKVIGLVGDLGSKAADNSVVHLAGAEIITGLKTFQSSAAGNVGMIVQGFVGQTSDLEQWKNSGGGILASIDVNGYLIASRLTALGGKFRVNSQSEAVNSWGYHTLIESAGAGTLNLIVKGAVSQTADLQQWQNDAGTVMSKIGNTGNIQGTAFTSIGNTGTYMTLLNGNSANFVSRTTGTSTLIVRSMASQTGDLLQLQNSAQTPLVWFTSGGIIRTTTFNSTQQAAVAMPVGGLTIDLEARAAIDAIRARLQTAGLIAA